MGNRTRFAAAALAAITALTLAPLTAGAVHCDSRIVIFSKNSRSPAGAVNSNAVTCLVVGHDADTRLINPASDQVSVRFTIPGEGTCQVADPANNIVAETRDAVLNGLGLNNEAIPLTCRYDATLDFYSFNTLQPGTTTTKYYPIDPSAVGSIHAVVYEGEDIYLNCFHTVGGTCPDF